MGGRTRQRALDGARRRRTAMRRMNPPAVVTAILILGVWEAAVRSGLVQLTFFPAPSDVAVAFFRLLLSGELPRDLLHTLSAALLGWLIGASIGVLVGLWLGISAASWRWAMITVEFLRSIPAITFVPVAALLFGFSLQMELVVTTYAALWPSLVNAAEGARKTSPLLLDSARTLGLSAARRAFRVVMPGAAGSILIGLQLSLALALTLAVAAEMVGNPHGMGYALVLQQQALHPAAMFAYIVALGLLGLALNYLLLQASRLLLPGIMHALNAGAR